MSNEEKPPMPAQPETKAFAAPDRNEILLGELKAIVTNGFTGMNARMDTFETNQNLQGGQIGVVEKEMSLLWKWKDTVDDRLKANSQRAAAPSSVDLKHEAALAEVIVKDAERDKLIAETRALAEQAATKGDVAKLAESTATKAEVTALVESSATTLTTTIGEKLTAQDTTLGDQNDKLDAILKIAKATAAALGSKRLRYFLLVCAALGAMAGGAVAGWNAHEVSKALPALHP